MDKKAIFRVMSMIGMVLGAVGTLLSNWADDPYQLQNFFDSASGKRDFF